MGITPKNREMQDYGYFQNSDECPSCATPETYSVSWGSIDADGVAQRHTIFKCGECSHGWSN